jgi:hypothetical protein
VTDAEPKVAPDCGGMTVFQVSTSRQPPRQVNGNVRQKSAMFIPRMWSDEVERIGKQRCTPVGYAIQGIGELIGFLGLLMLPGVPVYLAYRGVVGTFHWSLLWVLVVPFVIGFIDTVIVGFSWLLAYRKQFRYDYERRVSSWVDGGQERTYSYADHQAEQAQPDR